MEQIKKQFTFQNLIQFIKLQLAGNILFWGTYLGYFVLDKWALWPHMAALVTASLVAHSLFFIANKEWVFSSDTGQQKTMGEAIRFAIFMGLNFFINIGIITGLDVFFGITPYVGQFIAALFFTVWTWLGLKYWVFYRTYPHTRHHSLYAKRKQHAKRRKKTF